MRVVKLRFRFLEDDGRIVGHSARNAFWDRLRVYLSDAPEKKGHPLPTASECERLLRTDFAATLEKHFNERAGAGKVSLSRAAQAHGTGDGLSRVFAPGPDLNMDAWRGARFRLASIRYESLSLALVVGGAKAFMEMVERHPDVFKELLLGFAPVALDKALSAPASQYLDWSAYLGKGDASPAADTASESALVLMTRLLRPLVPVLVALAVLFLVAYNEVTDARHERAEIAKREDQFIDRQQKMLDTQATRITNLEKRIGLGSSGETPSLQIPKEAAAAGH